MKGLRGNYARKHRQAKVPQHCHRTYEPILVDKIVIAKQIIDVHIVIIILLGSVPVKPHDASMNFLLLHRCKGWPSAGLKQALGKNIALNNVDFSMEW